MIVAMVEYRNKNGRITVKGFSSWEELAEFTARLQKRGVPHLITKC